MRRKKWLVSCLALVGSGGLAFAIPALPAVGQSSPPSTPIILFKTAPIKDRGAVANVTAYVACNYGEQDQLSVSLTERSGKKITGGYGYSELFNCTGQIETIKTQVTINLGDNPFVPGPAFAQASLFGCYFGCTATTGTIHLVAAK
jgi:hypothetical protein